MYSSLQRSEARSPVGEVPPAPASVKQRGLLSGAAFNPRPRSRLALSLGPLAYYGMSSQLIVLSNLQPSNVS